MFKGEHVDIVVEGVVIVQALASTVLAKFAIYSMVKTVFACMRVAIRIVVIYRLVRELDRAFRGQGATFAARYGGGVGEDGAEGYGNGGGEGKGGVGECGSDRSVNGGLP